MKSRADILLLLASLISVGAALLGLFSLTCEFPIATVELFLVGVVSGVLAVGACWICIFSGVHVRGGTSVLSHVALLFNLIPWVFLVLAIAFFKNLTWH